MQKEAQPFLFVVGCVLFNESGQILLTQRPNGKSFSGLWEFPGGKKEEGETPEEALVREMKEELNILLEEKDLKPFSFVSHSYDEFHLFMALYQCFQYKGIVCPMEGQNYNFVFPSKIKDYDLVPADYVFLPLLEKM